MNEWINGIIAWCGHKCVNKQINEIMLISLNDENGTICE